MIWGVWEWEYFCGWGWTENATGRRSGKSASGERKYSVPRSIKGRRPGPCALAHVSREPVFRDRSIYQ